MYCGLAPQYHVSVKNTWIRVHRWKIVWHLFIAVHLHDYMLAFLPTPTQSALVTIPEGADWSMLMTHGQWRFAHGSASRDQRLHGIPVLDQTDYIPERTSGKAIRKVDDTRLTVRSMVKAQNYAPTWNQHYYRVVISQLFSYEYIRITQQPTFESRLNLKCWVCILVQVPIYRRHRIGRDGHLDQSEAYDIS